MNENSTSGAGANNEQSLGNQGNQFGSSMNAMKFGFFSKKTLLPGESWEDFVAFSEEQQNQLCPRNAFEQHILQQYIPLAWRIKRLPEIEAAIFVRYGISSQGNQCGSAFALIASVQSDNILHSLSRYEATLRKSAHKLLDLLLRTRKDGLGACAAPIIEAQIVDSKTSGQSSPADEASSPEPENSPESE